MMEFKVWRWDWEFVGVTDDYTTAAALYQNGQYHVSGFNYPTYPGKD